MRRAASGSALVALLLAGGCASRPIFVWPTPAALEQADRLLEREEYERAVEAYAAFLTEHPGHAAVGRARATRNVLVVLLNVRAELARLRQEMTGREGDLMRARQEINRLSTEAEGLKQDLERLKQVDIRLERRR